MVDFELGHRTRRILKRIARALEAPRRSHHAFTLTRIVFDTGQIVEGEIELMVLTDTQQSTLTFGPPLDRKGKPAKIQPGSVVFSIDQPDAATVTQDASNPFSALVVAGNPTVEGSPATITITADADLGDGVKPITGVEPLIVTSGEAVGFGNATVGEPVEQP
jgi:hypothetical protein